MHYQDTKDSIAKMIFEYTSSHDIEETRRCLRALDLPFFHHEVTKKRKTSRMKFLQFVKQAVLLAMENRLHRGAFIEMIVTLVKNGDISEGQLQKGFERYFCKRDHFHSRQGWRCDWTTSFWTILPPSKNSQTLSTKPSKKTSSQKIPKQRKQLRSNSKLFAFQELVKAAAGQSESGFPTHHPHSIQSFKEASIAAINEFFESSDMDEVAERILELEDPGLHHIFVKHAVQKAMDRRDREREMISNLLSFLYPQVLSGNSDNDAFCFSI